MLYHIILPFAVEILQISIVASASRSSSHLRYKWSS